MKRFFMTIFFLCIVITVVIAKTGLSVGGSLDIAMGSNTEAKGIGSINVEYKPSKFFSTGVKSSFKTNFDDALSLEPSVFVRLYPFSNAFAEASIGGAMNLDKNTHKNSKNMFYNLIAGASFGWRLVEGRMFLEPKINLEYVFGAAEPYSWYAGIGAGYNF